MKRVLLGIAIGMAGSALSAAQLTTLATLALDGPLQVIAEDFRRETGHHVKVQVDTSPNMTRRLAAGEVPDVLVATAGIVQQAIADGKAIAATRTPVGKIGVGVAASRGSARPDISTVEALKTSLLEAKAVLYSGGASGVYVEKMLGEIGIAEAIKGKAERLLTGGDVMQRLGEGRGNEIGFTMVSEIKQGESHGGFLVGPLPAAIQNYTAFDAVVMSGSGAADAASAFVRALTSPATRRVLAPLGWEF